MLYLSLHGYALLFVSVFLVRSCHGTPQAADDAKQAPKRIAIVGAGAAGSSAAYHLSKYARNSSVPLSVTVFERSDYIGGRSTTVPVYDDKSLGEIVELGASIFVPVNRILVDAVKEFNLSTERFGGASRRRNPQASKGSDSLESGSVLDEENTVLGIWNGEEFLYTQDLGNLKWWQDWLMKGKLLWRYGLAPIRTINLMKEVTGKFFRMYDEPIFPWKQGLSQAVEDVGLLQATGYTGEQFLEKNSVGEVFAREIIQSSTRVNYAQNLGLIHGVETMVCMATDGAMSVAGGNFQIFSHMLQNSLASVRLSTTVEGIHCNKDKTYTITTSSTSSEPAKHSVFDAIILAAPYHQSNIKFSTASDNPEEEFPCHTPPDIKYVNLHVTLFTSPHRFSNAFFNLTTGLTAAAKVPDVILTTLPESQQDILGGASDASNVGKPGFFSASILRRVLNTKLDPPRLEYVYKIFSPEPISDTFLSRFVGGESLLASSSAGTNSASGPLPVDQVPLQSSSSAVGSPAITWTRRHLWQSYPYLPPRVTFEEQNLDGNGLWYTSGVESFISTMETSALMGANVARLVVDDIQRETPRLEKAECLHCTEL